LSDLAGRFAGACGAGPILEEGLKESGCSRKSSPSAGALLENQLFFLYNLFHHLRWPESKLASPISEASDRVPTSSRPQEFVDTLLWFIVLLITFLSPERGIFKHFSIYKSRKFCYK